MKYMKISRNFKPNSAEMILNLLENLTLNEKNLSVEFLSNKLIENELASKPTIKNVLVASSKFLWLYNNETIIMDNNNKKILNAKNYNDYVTKWRNLFQEKVQEIEEIYRSDFNINDEIINNHWFKMRIFDMYLLDLFNKDATTHNIS